jgi:predicted RNA-binding Zn ribbon-like protein
METGRGGPLFRWLGEPLAIDLANTVLVVKPGDERDLLATRERLELWLHRERERLGEAGLAAGRAAELLQLRDAIRRLFTAVAQGRALAADDVRRLNDLSAAAPTYPLLELDAGGEPHGTLHSAATGPLAASLGRVARSAIELLGGPDRALLRICRAPNCGMFFVASPSKPGRRWCCAACGNRARVARHQRRRALP